MANPTYYAKKLAKALKEKGIRFELEHSDGYKSIDIFIPEAKLEIEVDGSQHHFDQEQALRDLLRTKFSFKKGKKIIRIPNTLAYNNPSIVADTIKEIIEDIKEKKKITKQTTIGKIIPNEKKERYELRIKKDKIKSRKNIPIGKIIIALFIIAGLIYFLNYYDNSNQSNTSTNPPESTSIPENIESIIVKGSKTEVIIENNLEREVSLNVTYRIYSKWFGADYQVTEIFNVDADTQKSFKVYNNDGCSTAPCSVSILNYEEIG